MKSLFAMTILASVLFSQAVQASSVSSLIERVKKMDSKEGRVTDKKGNDMGTCRVNVDSNESVVSVSLDGTDFYSDPSAFIYFSDVKLGGENTLIVSTNSDRPGGDACGDAGGAVGYKKSVVVYDNAIEIREKVRCTFSFFKKYESVAKCSFK